ncbi:MAG: hypothetical protein JJU29_18040 [Verrucomicrobia bacterium]|nr:hypothetical protein [Verrucomicrobiota bacterium]MCH8513666.1 hypothetical protein [Kiritimatiellia bacterium]
MCRNLLPSALLGFLTASSLHADGIASDSFEVSAGNYEDDAQLFGRNPSDSNAGFTGEWRNASGTSGQNTINLRASSEQLTHNLVSGSTAPGSIFAVANNTGRTVTRSLDSTATTAIRDLISNNGTLYFSALVGGESWQPQTSGGSSIQLGLGANRGHSHLDQNGGVFARVGDNGAFELSVTTSDNTTTQTHVGTLEAGETYLFILRIDFNHRVGVHRITMDLFDAAAIDHLSPTASHFFDVAAADLTAAQLGYLVFAHNNTGNSTNKTTPRFDEFRLGTSLDDVMAIPKPSTLLLLGLSFGFLARIQRRR